MATAPCSLDRPVKLTRLFCAI